MLQKSAPCSIASLNATLDNVIDVQMMRLRRKIDGEGAQPLIHTVRGIGYRLGPESP